MTEREKAKELVDKFGKEHALVHAAGIVTDFKSENNDVFKDRIGYWQKVKTEIEKL